MNLPMPLSDLLAPLFEKLPLDVAMPQLLPKNSASPELMALVSELTLDAKISEHPGLAAGLWLYVDDLDRSHSVSQADETSIGSLWHGIMHRREGDFWNSKYWFNRAGSASPMSTIEAAAFVDKVAASTPSNLPELLDAQRAEWRRLFEWCAKEAAQ